MGALVSRALRPIKSFNIENRAHRVISKEKPEVAPRYPSNVEDLQRVQEAIPDIDEKIVKKDLGLDERLKDVYVTSKGTPEDDITRLKKEQNPNRPLPKDRNIIEDFDFGLKEPESIPYGRTTLRQAIEYISSHQLNPEEVTAAKIAYEYKLKESDVEHILKYFRTFEIYVPETKTSKATFAGPTTMRKRLMEQSVGKIEGKKDTPEDANVEKEKDKMKNVS
ncbi:protein NDUFAF4 homolog [Zerene cesonia]|uniref:protein NDUFAF4 homolog n=1 Tax=Zerene cesonia TaxID=33412 RepID=UPI0018E52C54|nr:protein NDUFAF4 homolog [Zerene cesonia]